MFEQTQPHRPGRRITPATLGTNLTGDTVSCARCGVDGYGLQAVCGGTAFGDKTNCCG